MKITLKEWAARNYSPPPSSAILRGWRKRLEIHPEPEQVGLVYMVDDRAVRIPKQKVVEIPNMSDRALRILRFE